MKDIEIELEKLINDHIILIDRIEYESVHAYCFLREQFQQSKDISGNYLFHFMFRSFYRLDNAGLTPEYKEHFFKVMQNNRGASLSMPLIQNQFDGISSRLVDAEGESAFQASFISKMIHTIDDSYPIYDSNVAAVFDIKPYVLTVGLTKEQYYDDIVKQLKIEYLDIASKSNFKSVRSKFKDRFGIAVSDVKLIDFLVWEKGDELKKAAKAKRDKRRLERKAREAVEQ